MKLETDTMNKQGNEKNTKRKDHNNKVVDL